DGRAHRRRNAARRRHGPPDRGHRRRRERRRRSELVRTSVRAAKLGAVRPPRLELPPGAGRHRRRMAAHDVHARRPLRRARETDDARVTRGGRRLHDAAGPAPHHGRGPSPRSRPVGRRRRRGPRRLDVGLLSPGRRGRHRLRSHGDRQRRPRALSVAATRAALRRRELSGKPAAVVSPPPLGPPHPLFGTHAVGRALHPLQRRRRRRPPHAGDLGRRRGVRRSGAPRPRPAAARDPGTGGALVAQRLPALLPDVLAAPASRRPGTAAGNAGRLPQLQGVTSPTNDVTERPGSMYVNAPSTMLTGVCASRFFPAAVIQGTTCASVPPAIVKSWLRSFASVLNATTTTRVPVRSLNALTFTYSCGCGVTATRTKPGRTKRLQFPIAHALGSSALFAAS